MMGNKCKNENRTTNKIKNCNKFKINGIYENILKGIYFQTDYIYKK